MSDQVEFKVTGCHGFCERGPIAIIEPGNLFYQKVKVEDVAEIIEKTVLKKEVIERLLFKRCRDYQAGQCAERSTLL